MRSAASQFAPLRFSSNDLPERDRIAFCRETFGQKVVRVELEPARGVPFRFDAEMRELPGLRIVSCSGSPGRMRRSKAIVADGDDDFALVFCQPGDCVVEHRGRTVSLGDGGAVGISHTAPGVMTYSANRLTAFVVPRSALAPLVPNVEDAAARLIPQRTEALRLLIGYVGLLEREASPDPGLYVLAVTHVHDLIALALGASRDGAAMALGRGVRAARLMAIKQAVMRELVNHDLSVATVARRQGVSSRYIHRLFESEGTTFTQFVSSLRLARAHRFLMSPRHGHRKIADIAFSAGFGDVSHFNRMFRHRYGRTPSEVRDEALAAHKPRRED
jgi:AraC-like DNA-binding protein